MIKLIVLLAGIVYGGREPITYPEPNSKNTKPFTPELMVSLITLGAPKANPKGDTIIYTSKEYFPSDNVSITSVLSRPLNSNTVTNHTSSIGKPISNALWLDDNTILFTNKNTILSYNVHEKQTPKVWYNNTQDIEDFKYEPRGNALIFSSLISSPDPNKKFDTALVYDQLLMRHWDHWNTGDKSHLFTLNITPSGQASGKPLDLLKGTNLESPVEYSGGPSDYAISPDGKWVSFGAKKPGRDQAWETEQNIHLVAFDGSSPITRLTPGNVGAATQPIFSPDGKYLSWLSMKRRKYESDHSDIVLYNLESKAQKEIAHDWDVSASSSYWSLDSSSLLLIADDEAKGKLYSLDIKSEKITKLDTPHTVASVSQADKNTLLLTISSFGHPNDIYSIGVDGKNLNQLTDANSEKLKGIYLAEPEEFWFTGALGEDVQGWLLKPINFDPSKKYPVAVIIHGGPQSSYKDRFFQYHNFNLHASAGQAVVSINYHGSKGFGQNFTDSVNKNYETYPVEDHYKGLDHLISKYSWIDGGRVCTAGTSMGGYYGNWFNGHTKRFKCFIQGDGDFDLKQDYFTTDELWFAEYDSGGAPWEPQAKYDESNPANFVGNWTTPTLVVHNQKDYRVDLSAGLATFTALQRQGVASRFLYFPDESHGVSKPANLIRFSKEVVGWVTKWTSKY